LLYLGDYPIGIDAVLLSTKYDPSISLGHLREAVMQKTIKPLVPNE
jgi:S-adenosylmethionine synthetase